MSSYSRRNLIFDSLVELERPTAYHSNPTLPPNTFRCLLLISEVILEVSSLITVLSPGDLGRIEAYSDSVSTNKSKSKAKQGANTKSEKGGIEGVIYRVRELKTYLPPEI